MSQTPNTAIAVIGIDIGKSRSGKAVYWRAALPLGPRDHFCRSTMAPKGGISPSTRLGNWCSVVAELPAEHADVL
jgi:hypothetical protein